MRPSAGRFWQITARQPKPHCTLSLRKESEMPLAGKLHAEAELLRKALATITDSEMREEIQALIDEMERRARELGNGGGRNIHGLER